MAELDSIGSGGIALDRRIDNIREASGSEGLRLNEEPDRKVID